MVIHVEENQVWLAPCILPCGYSIYHLLFRLHRVQAFIVVRRDEVIVKVISG